MQIPGVRGKVTSVLLALMLCTAGSTRGAGAGGKTASVAVFEGIVESLAGGFKFPDGTVLYSAAGSYANVVVVAVSGGHFNSIQAALDSIVDATASNRYLVRVAPGSYAEQVAMKPFVDIEGSGELVTKITFTGFSTAGAGTVEGADAAELRFLTVENTGAANYAVAILNSLVSPRLTHITAIAQGATFTSFAIRNAGAAPELTDVRAVATSSSKCRGIHNVGGQPKLTRVDVRATFCAVENFGIVNTSGATVTMRDVSSTGSLGDSAVGILNAESTLVGSDIQASALGATQSIAMANVGSSLSIDRGTLRAEGETAIALENSAVSGNPSAAELRGVFLTANGTPTGLGRALQNAGSTASIHHSQLFGAGGTGSAAIKFFSPTSVVQVAHSQVAGGLLNALVTEITCLGAYDDDLTALNADCM